MSIRFLTSGESHGECLNAIIEGIGANFELDFDADFDLGDWIDLSSQLCE